MYYDLWNTIIPQLPFLFPLVVLLCLRKRVNLYIVLLSSFVTEAAKVTSTSRIQCFHCWGNCESSMYYALYHYDIIMEIWSCLLVDIDSFHEAYRTYSSSVAWWWAGRCEEAVNGGYYDKVMFLFISVTYCIKNILFIQTLC